MTALAWPVIMSLASNPACTVPGMVPVFWPAVVRGESSFDPHAIHDDDTGRSYYPATADIAHAITIRLMAAGHSIGIGLSQLTARSETAFQYRFGLMVRAAFDPCRNMKAGAIHYVHGALSIYNSGSPTRSLPYATRILADVRMSDGDDRPATPPSPPAVTKGLRDILHDPEDGVANIGGLIPIPQFSARHPKDIP